VQRLGSARLPNPVLIGKFIKWKQFEARKLLKLCRRVYDSMDMISVTPMSKLKMLREHLDFVRVAGYSATEVIKTFKLPQKAVLDIRRRADGQPAIHGIRLLHGGLLRGKLCAASPLA